MHNLRIWIDDFEWSMHRALWLGVRKLDHLGKLMYMFEVCQPIKWKNDDFLSEPVYPMPGGLRSLCPT